MSFSGARDSPTRLSLPVDPFVDFSRSPIRRATDSKRLWEFTRLNPFLDGSNTDV